MKRRTLSYFLTFVLVIQLVSIRRLSEARSREQQILPVPFKVGFGGGLFSGPGAGNNTYISKPVTYFDLEHLYLEKPRYGLRLLVAPQYPLGIFGTRKFNCCDGDPFHPFAKVSAGLWTQEAGGFANLINFRHFQAQASIGLSGFLDFEIGAAANLEKTGFYTTLGLSTDF